jgi:polysaccharide biosynthesis protein PslH
MKRNLLWITPKWPLPANDGARIATVTLLRHLSQQGERIDLVSITDTELTRHQEEEARRELGVTSVRWVHRVAPLSHAARVRHAARSLIFAPQTPVTLSSFARLGPNLTTTLAGLITETRARAEMPFLVYDGLHPAAHALSHGVYHPPFDGIPVVYRAHNREADIWARKAETASAPLRLFFSYQRSLVRDFEDSLCRTASLVATVSPEDLALFHAAVPEARGGVIPIGYTFEEPPPFPQHHSLQVMFLGRLDWHPNREGLRWFLDRVWPQVAERRTDLSLVIAGSGDGSWLSSYLTLPRLTFLGRIESVEQLYRESVVSIVPIFYGSGTRVKVIEASRFARPCLSTALGVEGVPLLPGEEYLRAESEDAWQAALCSLDIHTLQRTGSAAYERIREQFDAARAASAFREALDGVSHPRRGA